MRTGFFREVSALALLIAAGFAASPAHADFTRAENDAPLPQIDIPAAPDLADIIARDLASARSETPAAPQISEPASASPANEPQPEATKRAEPAPETLPQPGAPAVAIIERPALPDPDIRLDLPLPEPFVSFENVSPETRAAEAPAATPPTTAAEAPASDPPAKSAEAPVQLDLPPQPEIVVVIDVPKAGEADIKPTNDKSRAVLALDEGKIRGFLETQRAKLRLRPATIDGFVAAYHSRDYRAFWLDESGKPLPDVASLVATLSAAGADGLDADRLLALLPPAKPGVALGADAQGEADLAFSLAAFTFASDARGGRLDPRALSAMLTPKLSLPGPQEVLAALEAREGRPVSEVLSAYLPQHEGYRALRAELAKARAAQAEAQHTASIGGGSDRASALPQRFMGDPALAIGQSDARVPLLRQRLRLPAADDAAYTGAVVEAVKEFQRANDLTPNGRITPRTRALLDDPKSPIQRADKRPDAERRIADLIANLERWRWLPPELGATHVFVNIPEFRMEMRAEGERVFESRVIVGKVESQTPIFSDQMEFLVVNPSWFIPPTILKRDYLPKLAADPEYASRKGYEVIRRGNSISIRQPPGEKNALGHIKFMFPNDHAVYLHDTPGRHLFANGTRAFSAGCVRVEGPFRLAEAMLRRQGFDEKGLRSMVGRGERTIRLQQRFPVHLAYFTLFVDQSGALQSRPDLYGHDARLRRALQL